MQTIIPTTSQALKALMRADFAVQWKNRRSAIMVLLVPVFILLAWKGLVSKLGGAFVLSNCITIGLTAIGLMGYAVAIARDRDKGVFQRLRVSPVPKWTIMVSRLAVQLAMIILVTVVVFLAGYKFDGILLGMPNYALGLLSAIAGGAMYLGLGQAIVGLVKNSETVNSTVRLIYFVFIMVGMFGEFGARDSRTLEISKIVRWSPYGVVKNIVSSSLNPGSWDTHASLCLLVTIGYAIVFGAAGIKWFKWNTK